MNLKPNAYRFPVFVTLAFLVIFSAACNNANQETSNQSVTTTTNSASGANSVAPAAKEVESRNNVLVRVAHLVPGAPNVDLFVDNAKMFDNTTYKRVSPYKEVSEGEHKYYLRQAGQNTAQSLAEEDERTSDAGAHYTVLAVPTSVVGRPELKIIKDDYSAPANGKAKVRVIHAALGTGDIDVVANGVSESLFDDIGFADDEEYEEINPVNGTLEVRLEGKNIAVATLPNTVFEAGKLYTIFVVGSPTGGARVEAFVVTDEFTAPRTMNGNPMNTTNSNVVP
ncbi:MAG: DUF4397 domain-containing protein [Pyrinomonadaceae bacterium MAG19_C2-C3]|nr:DUF4397 domain-containing protein [Pyrinomonadaceae bacterium MAG19_C2-C3]